MPDYGDLVQLFKRISNDTAEAGQPADIIYGSVISDDPLKIQVDQKMILTEAQLVVAEHLTDREVEMSFKEDWTSENTSGGSGYAEFASHHHTIKASHKTIILHNALKTGDSVIMLKRRGGQSYVVLDRRQT